ncbi:EexN family lipoprotein [Variovorax sp.]|uniref:EexN family lipoprotein n=1 Tax=Variovorax sp. TaxID=1871043 RepID=UPI001AC51684|nr:EexN family lipoprotein [Burkholderiales bacterium]MBO9355669.1 EexN family lipoprotein [Bordetella petrii]
MNRIILALPMVCALLLAACGKPVSIESVESLVANPERLKELRAQCRADRAKVGDAQCNAVAEATRQRFLRPTPSPYANDPVKPPPPPAAIPQAPPPAAKD